MLTIALPVVLAITSQQPTQAAPASPTVPRAASTGVAVNAPTPQPTTGGPATSLAGPRAPTPSGPAPVNRAGIAPTSPPGNAPTTASTAGARKKARLAPPVLTTQTWCADPMTLCWSDDLPSFAGVRLLLEPRLDFVAQQNRIIDESSLKLHVVFGLEFNLFWAWLSMQAAYIAPYTTSISGYRTNDSNEVETWSVDANVVSGFSAGVSILDGIMAVGYGHVFYNNDQIKALDMATNGFSCADGGCNASDYGDGFLYVALQPVSAIRAAVTAAKQAKERRKKPAE